MAASPSNAADNPIVNCRMVLSAAAPSGVRRAAISWRPSEDLVLISIHAGRAGFSSRAATVRLVNPRSETVANPPAFRTCAASLPSMSPAAAAFRP